MSMKDLKSRKDIASRGFDDFVVDTVESRAASNAIDEVDYNLNASKDLIPAVEADAYNLSEQIGIPWNVVRDNAKEAKAEVNKPNPYSLLQDYPGATEFYREYSHAAAAGDKMAEVVDIEKEHLKHFKSAIIGTAEEQVKGPLGQLRSVLESYATVVGDDGTPELRSKLMESAKASGSPYPGLAGVGGYTSKEILGASKAVTDIIHSPALNSPKPPRRSGVLGYFDDVVGAGAQLSIQATVAALTSPAAAMGFMWTQIQGGAYNKLRDVDKVKANRALVASMANATAQAPMEMFSLKTVMNFWRAGAATSGGAVAAFIKAGSTEAITEFAQKYPEAVSEIWARAKAKSHDVSDQIEEFQNEFWTITMEALYEGAVGFAIPGFAGSLGKIRQQRKTAEFVEGFDAVAEKVEASGLKERSLPMLKKALESVGIDNVAFMSSEGLESLFQLDYANTEEILEELGLDSAEVQEAIQHGQDIQIPMADIYAQLTTEQQDFIKEDLKAAPLAYSARDMKGVNVAEEMEQIDDYYKEAVSKQERYANDLIRLREEATAIGYGEEYADDFVKLIDTFADRWAPLDWDKSEFIEKLSVALKNEILHPGKTEVGELTKELHLQEGVVTSPDLESSLTLTALQDPEMQAKKGKFVKGAFVSQLLNRRGVKQIEKDIMSEVLARDEFSTGKKFSYDDFRAAVESELMPLNPLQTTQWSDYGEDAIGLSPDTTVSVIWDSPMLHGVTGHFTDLYNRSKSAVEYEIAQVPGREDSFAAIDKDRPAALTEENLQEYVGTVGSKERVESWITERKKWIKEKDSGMFGWARRWDLEEDRYLAEIQSDFYQNHVAKESVVQEILENPKGKAQVKLAKKLDRTIKKRRAVRRAAKDKYGKGLIHAVASVRSYDKEIKASQIYLTNAPSGIERNEKVIEGHQENIADKEKLADSLPVGDEKSIAFNQVEGSKKRIKELEDVIEKINSRISGHRETLDIFKAKKKVISDLVGPEIKKHEALKQKEKELKDRAIETADLVQKQFIAHRKNYTERILKEEIKQAAREGKERLLFPTPRTIATIEGYIEDGEGGRLPYEIEDQADDTGDYLQQGDTISHGDTEYFVVDSESDTFEAVPIDGQIDSFDLSQFVSEEIYRRVDETVYDVGDKSLDDLDPDEWYSDLKGSDLIEIWEKELDKLVADGMIEEDERNIHVMDASEFNDDIRYAIEDYYDENFARESIDDMYYRDKIIYVEGYGGTHVQVFEDNTETFTQPIAIESVTEEDFDIDNLDETHQTVVRKYEELGNYLTKLRGEENSEIVEDDKGFKWYSTNLSPVDVAAPVALFQIKEETKVGDIKTDLEKGFNTWAEEIEVIEEPQGAELKPGKPLIVQVQHATTHAFDTIDTDVTNADNYLGKGFYSTSSEYDAEKNYKGMGPDLTGRVAQAADNIQMGLEEDPYHYQDLLEPDVLEQIENGELDADQLYNIAKSLAEKQLIGAYGTEGKTLDVYVKMKNPIVLTPKGGTYFEGGKDEEYYLDIAKDEVDVEDYTDDGELDEDAYNEALEEKANVIYWEDYNPQETGNLVQLREAVIKVVNRYGGHGEDFWQKVDEAFYLSSDGAYAQEVFDGIRGLLFDQYLEDDSGEYVSEGDVLRQIIQEAGYDGIAMDAHWADRAWNMGLEQGTWHFINWNPNNVKSVDNSGEFSLQNNNMYHQPTVPGIRGSTPVSNESHAINLFKNKDMSTLLHETGHVFLKEMRLLAESDGASESMKKDWETLRQWNGDNAEAILKDALIAARIQGDTQAIEKLSGPDAINTVLSHINGTHTGTESAYIDSAVHEQFARGFERYLMEGKAPTKELESSFERFKNWLTSVYKSVKALNVNLTDEVRTVFDNMFTSRNETLRAASENNLLVPTDAEFKALNVSTADQKYIKDLHKKAMERAEALMRADLIQVNREMKPIWTGLANDQMDLDPAYRVAKYLSEGKGMDRKELQELFPDNPDLLPVLSKVRTPSIVSKDGQGVYELWANHKKYWPELESMMQALSEVKTEKAFIRDYITQQSAELSENYNAAEYIMATQEFAQLLNIKNRYMKRASETKVAFATPVKAFKLYVDGLFESKTVADASATHKYMNLYNKYSLQAQKELNKAKPDMDKASRYGELSRLNFEMARKSIKSKEAVRHTKALVARLLKSKSMEEDAKFQVIDIAARYGLVNRKKGENLNDALIRIRAGIPDSAKMSLNEWVDQKIADGHNLDPSDFIVNGGSDSKYQELMYPEFEKLADVFKMIQTLDREERYFTAFEKAVKMEEVKTTLIGGLDNSLIQKSEPKKYDVGGWTRFFRSFSASHTKIEFLLRKLDGGELGGVWWNHIFRPIADAENGREDRFVKIQEALRSDELFGQFSSTDLEGWFHTRIKFEGHPGKSFTKNQVIAAVLNMGTLDNKQKLMDGYRWNEAQLQEFVDSLTADEVKFVQSVWDYIGGFREESFAVAKEMTGKTPTAIEAEPLMTPHGNLKGGYYPLKFDPNLSFKATINEAATDLKDAFMAKKGAPTTKPGAHINRKPSAGNQKVNLDIGLISDHIFEVVHDIAHRKAVLNVAKILRQRDISEALTDTIGVELQSEISDWLIAVANEKQEPSSGYLRFLKWARVSTTVVNMGLKLTTMLTQPVGITQTINELGVAQTAKGLRLFYGSRVGKTEADQYAELGNRIAFVMDRSSFMRGRMTSHQRDIKDATKSLSAGDQMKAKATRFYFSGIGIMQMGVDMPTWMGAYDSAIKKYSDLSVKEAEASAIAEADSVVRMTQGGGATKDLAGIQRGNDAMKLFTMFYSFFNTLHNMATLRAAKVKSQGFTKQSVLDAASAALWLWFMPAVLSEMVAGRGPDEDEEWAEWALPILGMYPMMTAVGARDLANGMFGKFGYEITPAQAAPKSVVDLFNSAEKAWEEGEYDNVVKDAVEASGYLVPWPSKQAMITAGNVYDYMIGEDPEFKLRDLAFTKPKSRR